MHSSTRYRQEGGAWLHIPLACGHSIATCCLRFPALQGFLERLDPQNVMLEALMKKDVMAVLCCPLAQDSVPGALHPSPSC